MDYLNSFAKVKEPLDWSEEEEVVLPRTRKSLERPLEPPFGTTAMERAVKENTKWTMLTTRVVGSLRTDVNGLRADVNGLREDAARRDAREEGHTHGVLTAALVLGMAIGYLLK